MAMRILVRRSLSPGKQSGNVSGRTVVQYLRCRTCIRQHSSEDVICNADIRNADRAAQIAAGQKHMPGFAPKERHRFVRAHGHTTHAARIAVQTTRHVDGDDPRPVRAMPRVQFLYGLGHFAIDIAGEPGTEYGINDNRGGLHHHFAAEEDNSARPSPSHFSRIALQRIARPQQRNTHIAAALGEKPGGNKPIATVIARPAQNDGRLARL